MSGQARCEAFHLLDDVTRLSGGGGPAAHLPGIQAPRNFSRTRHLQPYEEHWYTVLFSLQTSRGLDDAMRVPTENAAANKQTGWFAR